jgi:protein TonB
MKLKSLKFLMEAAIAFILCAFIACNNESGNNSSTPGTDSNSATGLPPATTDTSKNNTVTTKKKTGKVSAKMNADDNAKIEKDKMGYYTNSEVLPAYNGGQSALENYITNNIEYPQQAIDNNMEGTVSVHFLVDEKGNVSNVTTVGNKIGYGLEEEAVRVVSKMPVWTPGKVKGKNVKTWRTLPITYRFETN